MWYEKSYKSKMTESDTIMSVWAFYIEFESGAEPVLNLYVYNNF